MYNSSLGMMLAPPAESGIIASAPPELAPLEYPSPENHDPNWGRRLVGGVYTGGKDIQEAQVDYPVVGYNKARSPAQNTQG